MLKDFDCFVWKNRCLLSGGILGGKMLEVFFVGEEF